MSAQPRWQLATRDPDEARTRLGDIYCPHRLTLVEGSGGFSARQSAGGLPGMEMFDLTYGTGEVRVDPVPFDEFVLITQPLRGRFVVRSPVDGTVASRRDALAMDAYGSYQLQWHDACQVRNLCLERGRLEQVAAELRGFDEPMRVHFELGTPTSATAARAWSEVSKFLWSQAGPGIQPTFGSLARSQLFRFAAATLLDTFASSFSTATPTPVGYVSSAAVRRAMALIDQRAGDDLTLHEIAAAARLSTRGLQVAFQRHAQTTPLTYLRQVRLRRAHLELLASDPVDTTVASIASRWGFVNLGRFAAEHRKTFGHSPSEALSAMTT